MKKTLGRPVDPDARAVRRQQILDGARRCFVRKGFHASGMALISEEAGVSIANIYQYFETKDDLIVALVEEELENDLVVVRMLGEASTLYDGLKKAVTQLAGGDVPGRVQLRQEVLAESFRNPAVAKVVKKGEVLTIKALANILAAARARGEIAANVDPEDMAILILAFSDGVLSRIPLKLRSLSAIVDPAFTFLAATLGLKDD